MEYNRHVAKGFEYDDNENDHHYDLRLVTSVAKYNFQGNHFLRPCEYRSEESFRILSSYFTSYHEKF